MSAQNELEFGFLTMFTHPKGGNLGYFLSSGSALLDRIVTQPLTC